MKITSWIYVTGSVMCLLAVSLGAFGAHAFEQLLTEYDRLATYDTASSYHFFHGFALLLLSGIDEPKHLYTTKVIVAWCFIIGTIIFSGSLYLLSLTNIGFLGAITPMGGLLLLSAWLGMIKIGMVWDKIK